MTDEHQNVDDETMENIKNTLINVAMLGTNYCPGCAIKAMGDALEELHEILQADLAGGRMQ